MRRTNNSGFTLVELMIVLAIIAILLAIATIYGSRILNRYRVENQMKTMYADFTNARVNAMQRNRIFFVDVSSTRYAVYEDRDAANTLAPEGDGTYQATSDRLVVQKDLAPNVMTWNDTSTITFDTRGLLSGSERMGYVDNAYGAAYNCIVISSTRIRIGARYGTNCSAQ